MPGKKVEPLHETKDEPKVEPEPGFLAGIGNALNPTVGSNLFEKVGPLVITLAYLAVYFLLMMDLVPKPDVAYALQGVIGPFVGVMLDRMRKLN